MGEAIKRYQVVIEKYPEFQHVPLARYRLALAHYRLGEYPLGQLSISLAVPYATFILADEILHASGVIAVVAAGLTVNLAAPGRMSPPAFAKLRETWDLLAYWSGSLIFMLAIN